MHVKLCYSGPYAKYYETTAIVSDKLGEAGIRALFKEYLGIPFDEFCWYEKET